MLSRVSCLRCVLTNASKFVTTRKSFPVSNLLLHTANVDCNPNPSARKTSRLPSTRKASRAKSITPKVAVLINGCGGSDGSNVCETVCLVTQLAIAGFISKFFASTHFIRQNLEGEMSSDPANSQITGMRNSSTEAARLSFLRPVRDVKEFTSSTGYRALIIPGSQYYTSYIKYRFGQSKPPLRGDPFINELFTAIEVFHCLGKPIGTISSAGLLIAGKLPGVKFTMGEETYENPHARKAFGLARDWKAHHENRTPEQISHCSVNNVYSTPGSMSQTHTYDKMVFGIAKLVAAIKQDRERKLREGLLSF